MSVVLDEMKTRRSIRKFKPDMVPADVLDQIIEAGTFAANGRGLQSPIIIAVTNKEMRDKIMEMNRMIGGWPMPTPSALCRTAALSWAI